MTSLRRRLNIPRIELARIPLIHPLVNNRLVPLDSRLVPDGIVHEVVDVAADQLTCAVEFAPCAWAVLVGVMGR